MKANQKDKHLIWLLVNSNIFINLRFYQVYKFLMHTHNNCARSVIAICQYHWFPHESNTGVCILQQLLKCSIIVSTMQNGRLPDSDIISLPSPPTSTISTKKILESLTPFTHVAKS